MTRIKSVERVAKALHEVGTGPGYEWANASPEERQHAERYARAAIEALREPTPDQFEVANRLEAKYKADLKHFEVTGFCALTYQAMIDVALK